MSVVSMKELLESGVHFGHATRRWNPKMARYIYTARNGIYIIDLQKTANEIEKAYQVLNEIVANGGKVLFVGTKKQAQEAVKEEALRCGHFYVDQRWLGGTLTNFKTIRRRIKRLKDLYKMEEDGTFNLLPKKEVAQLKHEREKLEKNLGGIKEMTKVPDALFIVDPRKEHNAILEARKLNIPVFGIVDTNSDPDVCDYVIPANDDAVRSVKLITAVMADAICEAKGAPLEVAYTKDEGEEVSMSDVIKSSDKQAEARRQAKLQKEREERNQNNRYNKNRKPRVAKDEKKDVVEENSSTEVVTPVENNTSDENK